MSSAALPDGRPEVREDLLWAGRNAARKEWRIRTRVQRALFGEHQRGLAERKQRAAVLPYAPGCKGEVRP